MSKILNYLVAMHFILLVGCNSDSEIIVELNGKDIVVQAERDIVLENISVDGIILGESCSIDSSAPSATDLPISLTKNSSIRIPLENCVSNSLKKVEIKTSKEIYVKNFKPDTHVEPELVLGLRNINDDYDKWRVAGKEVATFFLSANKDEVTIENINVVTKPSVNSKCALLSEPNKPFAQYPFKLPKVGIFGLVVNCRMRSIDRIEVKTSKGVYDIKNTEKEDGNIPNEELEIGFDMYSYHINILVDELIIESIKVASDKNVCSVPEEIKEKLNRPFVVGISGSRISIGGGCSWDAIKHIEVKTSKKLYAINLGDYAEGEMWVKDGVVGFTSMQDDVVIVDIELLKARSYSPENETAKELRDRLLPLRLHDGESVSLLTINSMPNLSIVRVITEKGNSYGRGSLETHNGQLR